MSQRGLNEELDEKTGTDIDKNSIKLPKLKLSSMNLDRSSDFNKKAKKAEKEMSKGGFFKLPPSMMGATAYDPNLENLVDEKHQDTSAMDGKKKKKKRKVKVRNNLIESVREGRKDNEDSRVDINNPYQPLPRISNP